jgi:hypothetical protein
MKAIFILMLALISFAGASFAQSECPGSCCGGGPYDRIYVWLNGMGPTLPGRGYIDIGMFIFDTLQDGCDAEIEFIVERECASWPIGYRMVGKSWGCMVICGNPADCPEGISCWGCPDLFSHSCGEVQSLYFLLSGVGNFKVLFKGNMVFNQPFDFGGELEYFEMTFTDTRFLNKDFSQIQTNDIFDAMEQVAIEVVAEFSGDEPAPGIGVVLKSDIAPDSIIINATLDETYFNTATYLTLIEPGFFRHIIGDPDETLPPYREAEITAAPIPYQCEGADPVTVPEDILPIANFVLWVEEISFELDYDLVKDGSGPTPAISDPVWIKDTKNDPVAYRRANTLSMNVLVECNRTPYHDFQYWIMGSGGSGQGSYTTAVCEGHFNRSNLSTVSNIVPRDGPFPDSVGVIDPLNYLWWAKKIPWQNVSFFKYMNSSSHKIYLTYDTPLFSPVNILGLDKICRYSQDQNNDGTIAGLAVAGVYGEGWTYDPGDPISADPLDVIRNNIGQCADYANLLTYLYRSIGIPANSVTIYNGTTYQGTDYRLFWIYTGTNPNVFTCLLSNLLTSCDNKTKNWVFSYHATSFAAGKLCDASLGIIDTRANYAEWWKYYLQPAQIYPPPPPPPPYVHTEPPTFEPTYYDWAPYLPVGSPLPSNVSDWFVYYYHP